MATAKAHLHDPQICILGMVPHHVPHVDRPHADRSTRIRTDPHSSNTLRYALDHTHTGVYFIKFSACNDVMKLVMKF